jgi:hypothetical protein
MSRVSVLAYVALMAHEDAARDLATDISLTSLGAFNGPNTNANNGRRNALATRATTAANAIAAGDDATARAELTSLLEKIDGLAPPPGWMDPSSRKTALARSRRRRSCTRPTCGWDELLLPGRRGHRGPDPEREWLSHWRRDRMQARLETRPRVRCLERKERFIGSTGCPRRR